MKLLGKYSIGIGDRFGKQGDAQLSAFITALNNGVEIAPVWNKSNREHTTIGSAPGDVRIEADNAVSKAGFTKAYFVDADHINLETVDKFIESSDFFTIDVAKYIGQKAEEEAVKKFINEVDKHKGIFGIAGNEFSFPVSRVNSVAIAEKYLQSVLKASEVYGKIENLKGKGNFVTEISMDEVPEPQSPAELFYILWMLACVKIPVQTIAPRFSGRFNKGVDYVGNPLKFAGEFESDLMAIDLAVKEFGLPENLKISIHSGSDKFSIYPYIGSLTKKHSKGFHLKTAGTTWIEEIIGLAVAGGEALKFVKEIYCESLDKIEELCAPYSDVIDINPSMLPTKNELLRWSGDEFADALIHVPGKKACNPAMRQLVHVSYKLAAQRIEEYNSLLESNKDILEERVFDNIYNKHICRLFGLENIGMTGRD